MESGETKTPPNGKVKIIMPFKTKSSNIGTLFGRRTLMNKINPVVLFLMNGFSARTLVGVTKSLVTSLIYFQ